MMIMMHRVVMDVILKIMPIEKVYRGLVGGGGVGRVPEVLP